MEALPVAKRPKMLDAHAEPDLLAVLNSVTATGPWILVKSKPLPTGDDTAAQPDSVAAAERVSRVLINFIIFPLIYMFK